MKINFGATCALVCILQAPFAMAYAAPVDQGHPTNVVKDSSITKAIKTQLSADNTARMTKIIVKTDDKGVVWLSGSATTQTLIDQAVSIARNTVGVISVNNQVIVKTDE